MKVIYHLFQVQNLNILLNIKQLFLSLKSLRKFNKDIKVLLYTNFTFPKEQQELLSILKVQIEFISFESLVLDSALSDYPPVTKWLTTKPSFPYLLVDTDTCFYSNPIELLLKYKEEGIYLRESAYIIDKIANQRKEFILNNNCPNIFFSNTGVVLVNTDSLNSEKFDKTFKEISSRLKKQINSGDFSKFIFSHEWILEEVTFDLTLYQLNIKPYQFDSKDILQGKEALTSNPKFISHYFSINTKEYRKKLQED